MNYQPTPEQRDVLLWVADKVESEPHLYDFHEIKVATPGCGTPHFLLGWAALKTSDRYVMDVAGSLGFECETDFYASMDETRGGRWENHGFWRQSATEAARALRILAGQPAGAKPDWAALASGTNALTRKAKPMEVLDA